MTRRLPMALVGGDSGCFIGAVHRIAAELDGDIRLVAGAFSREAERSLQAGLAARRLLDGHPEGYLEPFANLYRGFAAVLRGSEAPLLPGIGEGVRSMQFIERAVTASRNLTGWVTLNENL